MTCAYCGCRVADGAEYCLYCKSEQPLDLPQRKKYLRQIAVLAILLAVQVTVGLLLSGTFWTKRFAQKYLEIGDIDGFVRCIVYDEDLQRDLDINNALEKYLLELNESLANLHSGDVAAVASNYSALHPLYDISSNDPVIQTVRDYAQDFAVIRSAYENLKKIQTMDPNSPYSYEEVFLALDAAYRTFEYSEQEYKEMCEAAFAVYVEHGDGDCNSFPESVTREELHTPLRRHDVNGILYNSVLEVTNRVYELSITTAIEEKAFEGPDGAVAQAIEYYNVKELRSLYGTKLADRVHAQLKMYLSELLQAGEYATVFTLLDDILYYDLDQALQANGEIASYYQKLFATAVSLHIAQQMDNRCYVDASNMGAVQIAHRYAAQLPEDIDYESVLQTAIAYEKSQLLQLINQARRANGCSGLKNNADLVAVANDFALHLANATPYSDDNDTFVSMLAPYGYEMESYGWVLIPKKAPTGAQCYWNDTDSIWDWLDSEAWLSDIGIGVHYHGDEETFYWYIIVIGK